MEMKVTDATGTGQGAKVDGEKRLHVDSVSRTQIQRAALQGNAYNISTGSITLTNANESAVLYMANDGDFPLIVSIIGVRIGTSTGGTGNATIRIYKNSTGGTIVSNASALGSNSNLNLGSAKILDGDYFKGAQGDTITGGTVLSVTQTAVFTDPVQFVFGDAGVIVPKGTNIAVTFQPPTSNTSQSVLVFATAYYETSDI